MQSEMDRLKMSGCCASWALNTLLYGWSYNRLHPEHLALAAQSQSAISLRLAAC